MALLKHFQIMCVPTANFGRVYSVQGLPERDTNRRTMKKVLLILAVAMMSGMFLTSCSTSKGCPAYGKVEKPASERPV